MISMARSAALGCVLAVAALSACREPAQETAPARDSVPAATKEASPMADKRTPPGGVNHASTSMPRKILNAMVADLATRLDVPAESIAILKGVPVTWNDGSLGCPEPGMAYAQVLSDGYWVVLEADGRRYSYHANSRGGFRLCENAVPPLDGPPPGGRYGGESY